MRVCISANQVQQSHIRADVSSIGRRSAAEIELSEIDGELLYNNRRLQRVRRKPVLPKREATPSSSDDDSESESDGSDEEMDLDDISDSENQLACRYPFPAPAEVGHLPSFLG